MSGAVLLESRGRAFDLSGRADVFEKLDGNFFEEARGVEGSGESEP